MSKLEQNPSPGSRQTVFWICILLAAAVFLVFERTLWYGFVNYDDSYFFNNPYVKAGLTWSGVAWAFRTGYASNWFPMTWLSHMLDYQLFGSNAGGHHFSNILLHATTVILLFLVLRRMTGALWPSAFVAAVFAIHPLRVESVAWVTERKDVLSGLFFMLTLLMYARYAQKKSVAGNQTEARSSRFWTFDYCLVLLFFVLGLMSKPMLVTVPFVLLLLDYWPLGRFQLASSRATLRALRPLLWEKLPMVLLAVGSSVVTCIVQQRALMSNEYIPLLMRILNAVVSYGAYIVQMIWPENLVALYPYHPIVIWQLAGAGALLLSATVLIIMAAKRFPYLLVGWFWYLGMLLPVIGLVQVGSQAHADRYTYLPQIGLYLIIAWGIRDLTVSWRHRQWILGCAAFVVITALMIVAWIQTSYWRSTESLWSHTLACTSKNVIAHNGLGDEFARQGRLTEAIQQYQKSLEINPNFTAAYNNLGLVLAEQGRLDDAIQYYQKALEKNPDYAQANNNLGIVLAAQGRLDEAIGNFQKALEINPDYAEAHFNLGIVLAAQGRRDEAIQHYREALRLDPSLERARQKLRALGVEP